MTHSLHRQGCVESLKNDFVVMTFGASQRDNLQAQKTSINRRFPRLYTFLRSILRKTGVVGMVRKISVHEYKKEETGPFVLQSKEDLTVCVRRLKEADAGLSVVVSGLIDEVDKSLKKLDIRLHTVQLSLGYFGSTDLLPDQKTLEITSMCGHHMIAPQLVHKLARDTKKGILTREEAAQAMANLCTCGIFNTVRAAEILTSVQDE